MGNSSQLVGYFSRCGFGSDGRIGGIHRGILPDGNIGIGLVHRHRNSGVDYNIDFHHTRRQKSDIFRGYRTEQCNEEPNHGATLIILRHISGLDSPLAGVDSTGFNQFHMSTAFHHRTIYHR